MSTNRLRAEQLCKKCSPASLGFETTDDLETLQKVIGQPRAFKALELGSEVPGKGFNIFVMGVPDSGRTTLSQDYLERKAISEPTPDDWCYVTNFKDARKPAALRLPAGRSVDLKEDIEYLIEQCQQGIQKTFSSENYEKERQTLTKGLQHTQEEEFEKLNRQVKKNNFLLSQTPVGFALVPTSPEGKPIDRKALENLSPDQQQTLRDTQQKLEKEVQKTIKKINEIGLQIQEKIKEFDKQTATFTVSSFFQNIKAKYAELEQVSKHLDALQEDVVKNAAKFRDQDKEDEKESTNWLTQYEVNILVNNSDQEGAPVILESHPAYHNIMGQIEHRFIMGASYTDFTLIRAGALHRANGGYLLIPARDMLLNPYTWEGLKRALRDAQIRILEPSLQARVFTTISLEPETIPLDTKIVLFGTPLLYHLLRENDEDFAKLFKIRADFATVMDRTPQNEHDYALFVKSVVNNNNLPPFDNTAIARLIEYSARAADDQEKLTTQLGKITNVIQEAAHWAKKEDQELVTAKSVNRAIQESIYRNNLIEERSQEMITQGTISIRVEGKAIGQVNALSVLALGEYAFGKPTRLTATTRPGDGGVLNIEREADLSGPIHTKGVLILSGFLGERYAQEKPLNLTASLAFEQSYGGVDGDSASAAELYALLSSLGSIPIRQDRAITGSIDQHGNIQAVGGLNEKVEGFFDVCQENGLTGTQGILIPASNVRHLMLNEEVLAAVEEEKFHVWPIKTFDEGIPLLTDLDAGQRDESGEYPPGTFNYKVKESLNRFAKRVKEQDSGD